MAVVVRGCGVAVARRFSGIRAGAGPVRYNPQGPERAKPARREAGEEGRVTHSRPAQLWRRAPSLREVPEEVGRGGGGGDGDDSFADAEMRRLKAEMMNARGSSVSRRDERTPQFGEEVQEALQLLRARELQGLDAALATKSGEELRCEDGWELESSDWNRLAQKKKRNASPSAGLVYGNGRKFEGVIPDANDHLDNPLIAADGKPFESAETEEDKAVAKEKLAAKNYALRLLAMAPQPVHKLRQKLIGRNVPESVIDSTIADLQRCGLQSDLEFAEAFTRSRWRSSLWGPQRLKQELRQRGVCGEDIDAALEIVFSCSADAVLGEGDWEGDGIGGRWGMTREASEHLWEKAKVQWQRGGSSVSSEARKRRMVGWLQRRGFNWSITSQILKSLESQD